MEIWMEIRQIVQGCAGDALKLMLVRMWNELFVPYRDKGVFWLGSIHDEINVICPKSLLTEVVPIILKCQTIKLPDWKVPLLPDLSIGTSFGSLIPFDVVYNEDGTAKEFIPQMEELHINNAEEVNMQESEEYIPEFEEDDYDYLQ